MRVKNIELHGFKSFALPTRLEFDEGIAAIVGPNGSGKSNLVEAVRWALGEQSATQLRGKRTEDLVWAGGAGRAPAGMAEVSITFDNSDRHLPIPFAEVTLTRRAYRSGENEYLINRSRVRLRDVTALTSALGQGYTVVSQGTADAALSLSAEGRRGLFEEAADISSHYARRDEALRRLSETQANADRVKDLLAELAPRLRSLSRQARQAREREVEEAKLRELRRAYYSRELRNLEVALAEAAHAQGSVQDEVQNCKARSEETAAHEGELKRAEERAQAELTRLEGERAAAEARETTATRALLSLGHTLAGLRQEYASAEARLEAAVAAHRTAAPESDAAQAALREAETEAVEAARALRECEARVAEDTRKWEAASRTVEALRAEARQAQETATRARNKVLVLSDRLATSRQEVETHARECEAQEARGEAAQAQVGSCEGDVRSAQAARDVAAARTAAARARLRECEAEAARLAAECAESRASLREHGARLRSLRELHDAGAGLNRGVQAVLAAAGSGKLAGVIGPLAALLEVPARFEVAVEAALGGALQNVVVREWRHAEAAIALLRKSGAGRVTFLPLDTLRPPSRPPAPRREGVIGIASELIRFPPEVAPAAAHALGRTLLVEDLRVAHALVGEMSGLSGVVTLQGDTLRPGGSLTGGSPTREGGALARHRELRELPAQVERLEAELTELEARRGAAEHALSALRGEARAAAGELGIAEQALRSAEARLWEARRELERESQALRWFQAAAERARADAEGLLAELTRAQAAAAETDRLLAAATARLSEALETTRELETGARRAESETASLRTALAVQTERVRAEGHRSRKAAEEARRATAALAGHRRDVERLRARLLESEAQERAAHNDLEQLQARMAGLKASIAPLQTSVAELRHRREEARNQSNRAGTELLEAEERRLEVALRLQKLENDHTTLRESAHRDLGTESIPAGLTPPAGVHQLIEACVEKLARIGAVNPLAVAEYDEVKARAEETERQLADLDRAQEDLRGVIAALEDQMERRFTETFGEVSRSFGTYFTRLFDGGAAALALVSKGDSVGVEIRVQPPGKRLGNLAALSGGERALTSCALLFALLRAGGAPFCVLDEVDAALDESNVTRFCDVLQELGQDTQFIVVTHNRGTIERASRLYGVSMESNGVSQLLSLKLEPAAQQRATA